MTRTQKRWALLQHTVLLGALALWGLLGLLPDCMILKFFKMPCLFCGMTRSLGALLRLDWQASLRYHPLTLLFCISTFVLINRNVFEIPTRVTQAWIILLSAAFVLVWGWRVFGVGSWAHLLPMG